MTKMILALIAFVSTNVLLYLAFAFIAWELDPSEWSNGGRALLVWLGAFVGVIPAFVAAGGRV